MSYSLSQITLASCSLLTRPFLGLHWCPDEIAHDWSGTSCLYCSLLPTLNMQKTMELAVELSVGLLLRTSSGRTIRGQLYYGFPKSLCITVQNYYGSSTLLSQFT